MTHTSKKNADALPFWEHQNHTVRFSKNRPIVYDTSDPGTGKTRAHLEVLTQRKGCALILAPRTLLQTAWGNDIETFCPDLSYVCAYAHNREAAFKVTADAYITNTDAVRWLVKQPASFFRRFDTLIIDEITSFKHQSSQRSRAIDRISRHFENRIGLTGTPNSTTITDIWHQIFVLDHGKRLGTSFFRFRNEVCVPEQIGPMPNMVRWVDRPGIEQVVAHMLSDITIRHEFEECMSIPPNHTYTVKYDPPARLMKQYRQLEEDAILELENDSVSALNAASLRQKLLQCASGAVYSERGYAVLDDSRCELILDLVEARSHSVVFFNWHHQRDQLVKEAEKRKLRVAVIDGETPDRKRIEIVKAYQEGYYRALFMHPKTGAHGLTLTRGVAVIWSSPIYEPDFLKQGLHRIYRGGQINPTETILVSANGTIENYVYERLNDRHKRMSDLLQILKENHK